MKLENGHLSVSLDDSPETMRMYKFFSGLMRENRRLKDLLKEVESALVVAKNKNVPWETPEFVAWLAKVKNAK